MTLRLALLLLSAAACWAQGQDAPEVRRAFSLAERVGVVLPVDWVERQDEHPPPPGLLAGSAPRLLFTDVLVLENHKRLSVLKLGISENPFFGGTGATLEAQMRAGSGQALAGHLFFFFFPPPRGCLARAKAALDAARRQEEARAAAAEEKRAPRVVSISTNCEFASTPLDFYAEEISTGVALNSAGRAEGMLRSFYLPPLEQVELDGKTFFIFETQGQRLVGRDELDKFNLPEDRIGARAYFFWAIGAETPFPFVRDPLRKNVPLYHIAYACLSTTGTAIAEFREVLRHVRFRQ